MFICNCVLNVHFAHVFSCGCSVNVLSVCVCVINHNVVVDVYSVCVFTCSCHVNVDVVKAVGMCPPLEAGQT
jgi:hypothetical protein